MPTSSARRLADYRIDPFDLRLFASVLDHGTITAAAQACSLSLAAASARLKALEGSVGATLLDRSKAGAAPTDAGRAMARHAHRVLAELESLHVEMAGFGHGLRGTIRLLCNTSAMAEALPPRIGRFLHRHPDIDLHLQEQPSDAVLEGLRRGVADIGIVADHVDTGGLVVQPWLPDELVAVLPPRGLLRSARTLRFADLLTLPFVGLMAESGLSRHLARQAERSGRVPHHRVRVSSLDAVTQLVAAGVGIAVMPRSAAERAAASRVRIVPLADAWATRRLLICTLADQAAQHRRIRVLIEALLDAEGFGP